MLPLPCNERNGKMLMGDGYGFCDLLNKQFFVWPKEMAEFCAKQKADLPQCQNCLKGKQTEGAREDQEMASSIKPRFPLPIKACKRCGEKFRPRSNRQKFCEGCKNPAKKDRNRGWMRKSRKAETESTGGRLEA